MTTHLVAMGGGGFSMEPRNRRLDDFVLALTHKKKPKICFIPTASGDSESYVNRFLRAFPSTRARTTWLPLFRRDAKRPPDMLLDQDVIYVGGGNTANLLALWRLHGVDGVLHRAWKKGVVLAGVSAGMNCWFQACSTDSSGALAGLRDGLGFIKGTACPHFDGEAHRRKHFHGLIRHGFPKGFAADDGAAFHFVDGKPVECVSSRRKACAYTIEHRNGQIIQTALPTRFLG